MARLFGSPFLYGSLAAEAALAAPGATYANGTWTSGTEYTWETSGGRSGGQCMQMGSSVSSSLPYLWSGELGTSLTNTYYARIAIKATAWGTNMGSGTGWRCLGICDSSFVGAELQIDGSGNVGLYNNGGSTLLSSGKTALSLGAWYVLELSWIPSTGVAAVRVNGTQVQTGTTTASTTTNIATYTCALAGTSLNALVSDWAANDSTGTSQNSWCGSGTTKLLVPSGDSSNTGFVNGSGSSSPLYPAVANLPPAGQASGSMTSTSQIYCSASSTTDNYVAQLESYQSAGISAGSTIVLVQPIASISGSSTTSLTGGLQSTANPTITETTGTTGTTAAATWPSNWTTLKAAIAYSPSVTLTANPTVEFRKGTANTAYLMAAFLGMLVEYIPGTATNSSGFFSVL